MSAANAPELPPDVLVGGAPEPGASDEPLVRPTSLPGSGSMFFGLRLHGGLRHGAYLLDWQPSSSVWNQLYGTMRVERQTAFSVTASGDLYAHPPFEFVSSPISGGFLPRFNFRPNPAPDPSAGIPIFTRSRYRSYLRVTQILETSFSFSARFTLRFEQHDFDQSTKAWVNRGVHTAAMQFGSAPAGYPAGATYATGNVSGPGGENRGTLTMGWVSPSLRRATIELDRVRQSEFPRDNGAGLSLQAALAAVDWDVTVVESDSDVAEPSGEGWSKSEMHAAMLQRRDTSDLDREWRYYLLSVRRIDSTPRGVMFDNGATDSNNVPREGAGIASHWVIPNTSRWGSVRGQRFGAAAAPYFRTAVHEIGHAFGLYHNTADMGFMNTTGVIAGAAAPGTFPANVRWAFNAQDARRLRHMPDAWVRPGMIPFGNPFGSAPISPADALDVGGMLRLEVTALNAAVPIGAPVRVTVALTNDGDVAVAVPDSVSLKSEHVTGEVVDPSGTRRTFHSIYRCVDEHETVELAPGATMSADMTLLRGAEGALFPAPGAYGVTVRLSWAVDELPLTAAGTGRVMVTPPVDERHAEAALRTLDEPDLLLTLAIGGDHLSEGNAALEAALEDDVLAPHYAVVQAKRLGRRFRDRKADPSAALLSLGSHPVASPSEAEKVAKLSLGANKTALKKATKTLCETLKRAADDGAEAVEELTGKVNQAKR
jgi:hypothetical protein